MKIREVNESDYEGIRRYLDVLPTDNYNKLCMVDFNDKRYIMASDNNVISIVENDNGDLNPMEINLDEKGDFMSYTTEAFEYVFAEDKTQSFIQKRNRLSGDVRHLHFVKDSLLEYHQFIADNFGSLNAKYELLNHGINTSSAITYTNYHLPTTFEVHESKETSFGFKEKIYFYHLIDEENYRRAYIVRGNKYYLLSIHRYPGTKLIDVYCQAFGFINTIDTDLSSYMLGTNEEINDRKSLVLAYEDYKKGQITI